MKTSPSLPLALPGLGAGMARRRAVSISQPDLVDMRPLFPHETRVLPLLCRAKAADMDLVAWAQANRPRVEQLLLSHGAILFRGFDVGSVAQFDACVSAMSAGALRYQFRASPRTQVDGERHIYTSTDYPADQSIFPHNEHSYSPVFPLKLFFWCDVPSPEGGETPLGDTREVFRRIAPEVRERFIRKRIMYMRNYGDGFGLPWQTVFQTTDRAEVETYCASVGIQVEWKAGDRLRTRQTGPAVVRHPRTGEAVWFNHATFFHVSTLEAKVGSALLDEFGEMDLPQNTYYGDGSPIEPETLAHLRDCYRQAMVAFRWERGDVVLLDNILAVHARHPFSGPRRILTAMSESFKASDLDIATALPGCHAQSMEAGA